jgi:tRNA-splicing endonuclease subunit Sen54
MNFDEDAPASATANAREAPAVEEDNEGEGQDYASVLRLQKTSTSGKKIRRGEKDFESHGTQLQENTLEASRNAMQEVLSYTRVHPPKAHVRGWYFPGHCPVAPTNATKEDGEEEGESGYFGRERVVFVEMFSGSMAKTTGRAPKGLGNHMPGWDKTWLLPEEALYLVERGDLTIWWPRVPIEDITPSSGRIPDALRDAETSFEYGTPLSLQAAYSLLIGGQGDQSKIPLEHYQVYANLRRSGYLIQRAVAPLTTSSGSPTSRTLWQWLFSLISENARAAKEPPMSSRTTAPLVRAGLYRSYASIYSSLYIIPRHKPAESPNGVVTPQPPFKVSLHVYRSRPDFQKSKPGPPDFRIAVINARTTSVPTLEQLSALVDASPWDPPDPPNPSNAHNIGLMYKRLKHGWRNVILAVVDGGLISYLKISDMAFGEERLYERFDAPPPKASKKGGSQGGKRGGRSQRGRRR